jgi:two-component system sensor histidine kinase DegS
MTRKDGSVKAVIEDDGIGFDPAHAREDAFGLSGMRERVALLDGNVEIESSPDGGTSVAVEVPTR